jgi:hypothetical protein
MTEAVLAMVTDDAALADHVAARRAALTAELERIRAQKAALEAKLAELRPPAPPKKGGGGATPAGSAGKKRPPGGAQAAAGGPAFDPSLPLSGPAKRARLEADRERRMNLLWQQCVTIVKTLMRHRDSAPFHKPVDPVALKCPDYLTIIKTPMDLGTALSKLGSIGGQGRVYASPDEFRDDVRLMFANCRTYNKVGTPVRRMGDALSDLWEKKWAQQGIEAKWALEMERQKDEQLVREWRGRWMCGEMGEKERSVRGAPAAVARRAGVRCWRRASRSVPWEGTAGTGSLGARKTETKGRQFSRPFPPRPPTTPQKTQNHQNRSWTARRSTSSRCARWTGSCARCRRWPPPRAAPHHPAPPTRASGT